MENKIIETEDGLNDKFKREIDDVKTVIWHTLVEFHNHEFRKYIQNYKKYLGFVHDRLSTIDSWQSNVDYPLVASVVDTMFGNIFDFGYEFGINDSVIKKLCSDAFDFRNSGRETFKEVSKEILITGKGYVKDYLIKEEEEYEFFWKKIKTETKTPSMHYVSIFDVLYDRTKGLTKSPYKIIRTFATAEDIKKKYLPLILEEYAEWEERVKAEKKFCKILDKYKTCMKERFSMYDYNPVKMLTHLAQLYNSKDPFEIPICKDKKDLLGGYDGMDERRYNFFLSTRNSTYELIEYTTFDKKYVFVNGQLIYTGKKLKWMFNIQEANFSIVPGSGNANGVADQLGNLQDINNSLWNSFLDNIKLVMGPMFKVTGNLPIGKNGTLDFKKFRAFKTAGTGDIEKIQLGVTDFAPINFMQIVQGFAEQRSGVNNYVMGGQGAIERVTNGVDVKFNQYKAKLTPITDSIDQMMGNIARSWVMMFLTFYTKKELGEMGVTIEDKLDPDNGKFITFMVNGKEIENILDERAITFTYNSLHKQTKENSRKAVSDALPFLLQYAGNKVNLDTVAKILVGQDFDPEEIILKNNEPIQGPDKGGRPPNEPPQVPMEDPNAEADMLLQQMQWGPMPPPQEQLPPEQMPPQGDLAGQILNM